MAFTFNVLHQFHLHHLESKESAYDFVGALRRLMDNAFAQGVSVSNMTEMLWLLVYNLLCRILRHSFTLSCECGES